METLHKSENNIEPEVEEFLSLLAKIAARVLTQNQVVRENQVSGKPRNKVGK